MLLVRPALPIDETRYLGAAWEMWWRDSIAVPYLNGRYYDGKPPLLFWLMHLGWWLFGVNEWWPRLVGPLFGLASLFLVRAIAARLWDQTSASEAAPWLLLGSFLWAGFCASTMFDMLLGCFALLSVYAIIRAWQSGELRYFAVAGLALGLGILAKGPVVFLPALFIVASSPWWMTKPRAAHPSWGRWYGTALGAAGISGLVALAWLIPMAMASDADYLRNMTIRQTLGYTVDSFSHASPVWWYLPLLPLVLFPWALWPRAWQAVAALRGAWTDSGVRLCLVWTVAVFLTFSLISGKRAHYLLLFFPAVALLLARLLPQVERVRDATMLLPALAHVGAGALLVALAQGLIPGIRAPWVSDMPAAPLYAAGAMLAGLGVAIAAARGRRLESRIRILCATTCAMTLVLAWALMRVSSPAYDVRPMSAYLAVLEPQGAPLAAIARYDGQYLFYGRMKAPVEPIPGGAAGEWARAHPGGYILSYQRRSDWQPAGAPAPARAERYRGGTMVVWHARDIVAHPEIVLTFD
jgi:4-amino-4-deoxy-L-arabinose transferase-like glycosyltransferase